MIVATISELKPKSTYQSTAELQSGDCMSRNEFHQIYLRTPDDFHAELIEGIVYVASPVGYNHCIFHSAVIATLTNYSARTTGVVSMTCGSTILGEDTEVQPDAALRIEANAGGRSRIDSDLVFGPPELVVEVAHSSRAIDLHSKKRAYQKAGVYEYLVLCVKESELAIYNLRNDQGEVRKDGVYRSVMFPGLWIEIAAWLSNDLKRTNETLEQGLASPEHAEFVKRLTAKG